MPKTNKKSVATGGASKEAAVERPAKLPGAFTLLAEACRLLITNWKLFGGIMLVYGIASLLFVQGVSGNLDTAKTALEEASGAGTNGSIGSSLILFTYMAGASGNTGGALQIMLVIMTSLALIWALRHVYAKKSKETVRIRDSFYRGMYPLVPFLLVLGVLLLQLIPLMIGGFIYGLVNGSSTPPNGIEMLLWTMLLGLSAAASLYLVCSSVFALYIVCLPDTGPVQALRLARTLVQRRRWTIVRKLLFLPISMFVITATLTVPIILIAPAVASVCFFILSLGVIAVVHGYLFTLYRKLL